MIKDTNGNVLKTISATDSTYTTGHSGIAGADTQYFDNFKIEEFK